MATRAALETLIADDLARGDITNQITSAVNTAIRSYRFERLGFNEAYRVTASLSSSVASIALSVLPSRFRQIDRLRLVRSTGNYIDLHHRDYDWIMNSQDAVAYAQPAEYCVYNNTIYFDSYADQAYTFYLDGLVDIGEGTSLSYSTASVAAWFNDGKELIRHRAKRELYANVIMDMDLASIAKIAEMDALRTIKAEIGEQNTTGFIRPTQF